MTHLLSSLALGALVLGSFTQKTLARTDFNDVGHTMAIMLEGKHFSGANLKPDLSTRILELYFEDLDPQKLYFQQSDIDEFLEKYGDKGVNQIDQLLLRKRIMQPAHEIHARYSLRVQENLAFAEKLITNAYFDFTSEESTPLSREDSLWPKSQFESQSIWRLRIAGQLLAEELERETIAKLAKEQNKKDPFAEKESPRETIKESYQHILKTVQSANEEDIAASFLSAVANAHDPHTDYLSKLQTDAFNRELRNQLTGIGAQLTPEKNGTTRISGLVVNGPAQKQGGLKLNDRIVAVDPLNDGNPVDILFMPSDRVVDLILGKKGTEVGLIIKDTTPQEPEPVEREGETQEQEEPPSESEGSQPTDSEINEDAPPQEEAPEEEQNNEPAQDASLEEKEENEDEEEAPSEADLHDKQFPQTHRVVIKRDVVNIKSGAAKAELILSTLPDGSLREIGWITFPSFYYDFDDGVPSVYEDVRRLVTRLKKEGVDGIGIDLRDNGGGSLTEVARMAGLFIGDCPVVQIKGREDKLDALRSNIRKPLYTGPLLIATNKYSASASEILAGVLQDYNRAVVVGDSSSFGKGTVQWKMDIGRFFRGDQDARRAGELKLTVQKFYRVNGSSTQLDGVVPDIVFPSITDAREVGEKSLTHALPHDLIRPAQNFIPLDRKTLFLPKLASKSFARVANSQDFAYEREDIEQLKQRIKENKLSLNIEERRNEIATKEERRITRNKERRKRFAQMEKEDEKRFQFLRLTLDDLSRETLIPVDRERDAQSNMILAPDDISDLANTPSWPNGLDPVRRESLEILLDLIHFTEEAARPPQPLIEEKEEKAKEKKQKKKKKKEAPATREPAATQE